MGVHAYNLVGSIPAWAGEPLSTGPVVVILKVYPRVGGGTCRVAWRGQRVQGLSPRGRGNPAGESESCLTCWVYPRVGGGTHVPLHDGLLHGGLSPRGRGNRIVRLRAGIRRRSIPAWAGEPQFQHFPPCWMKVYPRVGGGTRDRAGTW